jgi:hypothetical protein
MCFLFEQQCRFDLSIVDDSNMFTAARDDVWTNRITFFLAKVCGVCWGQEVDRLQLGEQLDRVETDVNSWRASIPDSFEPWYNHHSAGEPFPTIRYFSRWHAIGWQQYYTAKTMIAVYRQGLLPLGTYHEVNDYLRTNILVPARMACGVILSGKDIGVGINGGHLAYWCGQFFTGVEEQRIILNWLNDFMEKTKWPNKTTIERLKGLWGRDQRQRRSSSDNPLGE